MAQRLRITFSRGAAIRFVSHLELMRMWERVLRRAGWRLAYSHGFSPHPKLSFAAPLPVGVEGEAELLEVILEEPRTPPTAVQELAHQMPPGARVLSVQEVPAEAPPLQRFMVAAEYLALAPEGAPQEEIRAGVERLLGADVLPRRRAKEGATVEYDLRPMVRSLSVEGRPAGRTAVRMELRSDARGAGRPDEVLRELGFDPAEWSITRTRLVLGGAAGDIPDPGDPTRCPC